MASTTQEPHKRSRHIAWDEHNLAENEKIKAQFCGVKIDEPKTPYHGPLQAEELDADFQPLNLDEEAGSAAYASLNGSVSGTAVTTSLDSLQEGPSCASGFSSDHDSSASSGRNEQKRRRFEQHRKAHYQMGEALRRAREILRRESESGDPDDGDDQGSAEDLGADEDGQAQHSSGSGPGTHDKGEERSSVALANGALGQALLATGAGGATASEAAHTSARDSSGGPWPAGA